MTEFAEAAMRRIPRCRSKLPAPVSNPREAFLNFATVFPCSRLAALLRGDQEQTMRATSILVAGLMALAAGTVAAQAQQGPGMAPSSSRIGQSAAAASDKLNDDSKALKANEKAYSSALKNLPDKQFDPWRGMR